MLKSAVLAFGLIASGTLSTVVAQALPPVYFNHATIFVPKAVYSALLQSAFLRDELSGFQEQTVQRDGGAWSYTGIYLSGQHTYLEFFSSGPQVRPTGTTMAPAGLITFNMWLDDRGQLPRFKDRLVAETGTSASMVTTRNGKNEPSYDTLSRQGAPTQDISVRSVLKGYYPDGITREKRMGDRYIQGRYFRDITAFTLTVNEKERDLLLQDFRAYSYSIRADGQNRIASGPGVTFSLIPSKPGEARSLVIDLALNRAVGGQQVYTFEDSSELHLEGSTAKWKFTFPAN